MTSEEALEEVRAVATKFSAREADIRMMWSGLHGNLNDLCQERPLEGDLLDLLYALERWEVAIGPERDLAVEDARAVAGRIASSA